MNLPTKACLGAGAFLVLSGGLLALTGFLMGGDASLGWSGQRGAVEGASSTPSAETAGALAPFAALNVDLARGSVSVVAAGEDYEISVTGRLAEEVSYELTGDTLTVTGGGEGLEFFSSGDEALVMVTVPEGAYLESADLNADMGQVEVDGITAAALQVSSGLGNVDLSDVTAGDVSLTLSMGDLTAYGLTTRKSLSVASDMGDVSLDGTFLGESSVSLSMGDLELTAAQPREGCALDLSTGMGDVYLDGEQQSNPYSRAGDGDAITASNGMGDVSVTFTE